MSAWPRRVFSSDDDGELNMDPRHEVPPQAEPPELPDVRDPFSDPWRVLSLVGLATAIAVAAYFVGTGVAPQ